jgi:putative transposase
VIFCTKYRKPLLKDEIINNRCKDILNQVAEQYQFNIIEAEVMEDHVHLLVDINPRLGITKVIKLLKGSTSKFLREEFRTLRSRAPCLWTGSYFVSTVGSVSLETVKKYIENQKNI